MQPSADPIRVLTVDPAAADTLDDADDRFDVVAATDSDEALAMLDRETFDCVVAPADLPDASGLDLLELVRARAPEPPFVVTAADGSEALASRAIAAGVTDYVPTGMKSIWAHASPMRWRGKRTNEPEAIGRPSARRGRLNARTLAAGNSRPHSTTTCSRPPRSASGSSTPRRGRSNR
ncbi:MAG: response regulator [Halanaeroarchaeum sp.]